MMPSFGLYTTNDYQDRQAIHDMFFMEIWLRGTTLTRFSERFDLRRNPPLSQVSLILKARAYLSSVWIESLLCLTVLCRMLLPGIEGSPE